MVPLRRYCDLHGAERMVTMILLQGDSTLHDSIADLAKLSFLADVGKNWRASYCALVVCFDGVSKLVYCVPLSHCCWRHGLYAVLL